MSPFTLPIAELRTALIGLGKVVARRVTLPILGTIKIERTTDGWIALTGTDLDRHVTVRLEQPASGEPAALLVPYEDLVKTCKACGHEEEIVVERRAATTATIKYRIGQQFVETAVESLPVDEFPEIPRFKGDATPVSNEVRQAIHEALQCASTDETRLILNGAYLDVSKPNASYVIATDGRHLFSSNSFTLPLEESLIVPTHKFIVWKEFNNDGEWQIKSASPKKPGELAHLQISTRRWRFIARQIEGNYPNWRQVVPDAAAFATTIEFEGDIDSTLKTIQRMPCDDTVNYALGLEYASGKFSFLGRSPGSGDWTRIEVSGAKCRGKEVKIFLNRNFLSKALQFGLTKVETIDGISPLRFSNGGRQMIVMPTRPENPPAPTPDPIPTVATALQAPQNTGPLAPTAEPPADPALGTSVADSDQNGAKPQTAVPPNSPQKPALETALAQLEVVRGDCRNVLTGLNKLGEALKQAQRENKVSEKEISSVRATLRSLQTVRI